MKTEWIVTSKAELAQKKVNDFIEAIENNGYVVLEIKPLIAFSGPALMIGAMIEYEKEEEAEAEEKGAIDESNYLI